MVLSTKTMTEQSSPLYLKELLMKIKIKNGDIGIDDDLNKLLSTIDLHHLPKPFVHGKKCSNCDHRMHCKSLRCPKCHCEMRKRKREEGGEIEETMTEEVAGPGGMAMASETIEEPITEPGSGLTYEELRQRLPAEITDDIIVILAESTAALVDFAEIQTQTDVDQFNMKYGVNLALPSGA